MKHRPLLRDEFRQLLRHIIVQQLIDSGNEISRRPLQLNFLDQGVQEGFAVERRLMQDAGESLPDIRVLLSHAHERDECVIFTDCIFRFHIFTLERLG